MSDVNQKIKRLLEIKKHPELALFQFTQEIEKMVEERIGDKIRTEIEQAVNKNVLNGITKIKGEAGDRGEKGENGDTGNQGPKGETGLPGIKGDPGIKGETGSQGITGIKGEKGPQGSPGVPGSEGKQGSPDTPKQVREKLEILKGSDRLDASAIKNLPEFMGGRRTLHRGGIQLIWSELLGTGDGSTVAFTLTKAPKTTSTLIMSVGGGLQFLTDDFTISGKTITFLIAPPKDAKVRALVFQAA